MIYNIYVNTMDKFDLESINKYFVFKIKNLIYKQVYYNLLI